MKRPDRPPRPPEACLLCPCRWDGTNWHWPKAETGYRTCQPCADRLSETLRAVRDGYRRLTPERLKTTRTSAPGFRSGSPANDLAIALTDRRNTAVTAPGDVPDVVGELHSWAQLLREDIPLLALDTKATLDTESGCLLGHLPWITRQSWVDEFATVVTMLHAHIQAGNGEGAGRIRIGPCPDCGAALSMRSTADLIRCDCGAVWHRTQWEVLGRALNTEAS